MPRCAKGLRLRFANKCRRQVPEASAKQRLGPKIVGNLLNERVHLNAVLPLGGGAPKSKKKQKEKSGKMHLPTGKYLSR